MLFTILGQQPRIFWDADAGNGGGSGHTEPPSSDDGGGEEDGGDSDQSMVTMPQARLDQQFAERASRARTSAINTLLSDLNIQDVETLTATVQEWRDHQRDQQSESERLQTDLTSAQSEVANLTQQLSTAQKTIEGLVVGAAIRREARTQNFLETALDDVVTLINAGGLDTVGITFDKESRTVKGVSAALKKLAETKPHFLTPTEGNGGPIGLTPKHPKRRQKGRGSDGNGEITRPQTPSARL